MGRQEGSDVASLVRGGLTVGSSWEGDKGNKVVFNYIVLFYDYIMLESSIKKKSSTPRKLFFLLDMRHILSSD